MIKVNDKVIEFKKGVTIKDAIRKIGMDPGESTIVMLEGKVLSKEELLKMAEDNTSIKVLTLISGG